MASIRVGVQAATGSPGQQVDFDSSLVTSLTLTNVGTESIQYSTNASTFTTVASGASAVIGDASEAGFRLRKLSAGAYPVPVDLVYTPTASSASLTGPELVALIDGELGGSEWQGGGGGITVQEEGTPLSTAATTLNFVGSGVTASGTGATKTITISGGGASNWGDLGGTLANQTDLQAALDAKAASSHSHAESDVTGLTAALAAKQATHAMLTAITASGIGTIASAATCDLDSVPNLVLQVTGTTGITSFGTAPEGTVRLLRFADALTITYNGSTLILPNNGGSITTAAGDTALCYAINSSGGWRVAQYQRASGQALQGGGSSAAADITVADAGGYFTATNVEAALAELAVGPSSADLGTAATTLVKATHGNRACWINDGSDANTHTIDDDTGGGWNAVGDFVEVANRGTGIQTFQGDGTSTLTVPPGFKDWISQNEVFTAQRVAANAWVSTTVDTGGTPREITGAATLGPTDANCCLRFNSASTAALTVPADSTMKINANNRGRKSITVYVDGAGVPTFSASGTTIQGSARSGLAQHSVIVLLHTGEADTWVYA